MQFDTTEWNEKNRNVMQIQKIYIKGFRNFKETTVNFENHSLIICANDVGKTNLIYSLRLLLYR